MGGGRRIEAGTLTFDGHADLPSDPLTGEGNLAFSARGLILEGIVPLHPRLGVEEVDFQLTKEGPEVLLKAFRGRIEGVEATGEGMATLSQTLERSPLSAAFYLDLSGGEGGALQGMASLLKGAAGAPRFNLQVEGTAGEPRLAIDGKPVF